MKLKIECFLYFILNILVSFGLITYSNIYISLLFCFICLCTIYFLSIKTGKDELFILETFFYIKLYYLIFYVFIFSSYIITFDFNTYLLYNSFIFSFLTSVFSISAICRINEKSDDNIFGISYLIGSFFIGLDIIATHKAISKLT